MLQTQYYNSGFKNKHINRILNTYRIKYSQIKNEIDSKINQMMKFFLNDILNFLENIEDVAEKRHKLNEYESMSKELELAREKIKDKISIEHKLRNECEALQQENSLLKLKINSLNYKINNLNININNYNSHRVSPIRIRKRDSESFSTKTSVKSKYNCLSPKIETTGNFFLSDQNSPYNKSSMNFFRPKTKELLTSSVKDKENIDKLALKINYDKKIKIKNKILTKKKNTTTNINTNTNLNTNTNINKNINTNNNKNNKVNLKKNISERKKNINLKKTNNKNENNNKTKSGPINKKFNKNKKLNISLERNNTINFNNPNSPKNTINQSIEIPLIPLNNNINTNIDSNNYELAINNDLNTNTNINSNNFEVNINNMIDNELKELKRDEENIELLLDQLNDINESDII